MPVDIAADELTEAVTLLQGVASHMEQTFAQVGNHLGEGHGIFQELNGGLTALSQELSGTSIEGASTALQDIAGRLNGLAEALPRESALLGRIGESTAQASALIKPLIKQIGMVAIIARSARIEAASLDGDRNSFLDFTQEVFDLAKSIQLSIDDCVRDQHSLSAAIVAALKQQKDFETRYQAQLLSVGVDLNSAYAGMREQQKKSAGLMDVAGASTRRIAAAVGNSIISLQAGDSARQRLEHICGGLQIAVGSEAGIVPALPGHAGEFRAASLIFELQAAQLKDTISGFDADFGQINRSLAILLTDAASIVDHGRSLSGGQGDNGLSFLDVMKQALAHASVLIRSCDDAGRSVDDALSVVEETLGKFRSAISGLSETVIDIILIGMNAGLKAGHLGNKGSAFVVIANELKATANHIAAGAKLLKPALDDIERAANDLKNLRVDGDPSQLAKLEPAILHAVGEIETGNDRLAQWMKRLVVEGAQFEGLMTAGQGLLAKLGETWATLPGVVARLRCDGEATGGLSSDQADAIGAVLDDLYARYTMTGERNVHHAFLQRHGLAGNQAIAEPQANQSDSDDILLF
jgi:hypothetical protein